MTGWTGPLARSIDERRVTQRAFGLALVALLHLLLLLALLQSVIHPIQPKAAREIFLRFVPRPHPKPEEVPGPTIALPPLRGGTPPTIVSPPVTTAPAPDLRGLGQNLFGCSPESLATALPETRSACLNGFDRRTVTAPVDHSKNPDRWANAIRERNAPPGRIPCTYIAETPVIAGGAGGYKVPMVEMVCLHKLLSH